MTLYYTSKQVDRLRQAKAEIEWVRKQGGDEGGDNLEPIEQQIENAIDNGTGTTVDDWK